MNAERPAAIVLAMLLFAVPARAEVTSASASQTVAQLEKDIHDLDRLGGDADSLKSLSDIVAQLKGVPQKLASGEASRQTKIDRVKALKSDLETCMREIERLKAVVEQEMKDWNDEHDRLSHDIDVYNRTQARTYNLPDEQAGYDAAKREESRLNNWKTKLEGRKTEIENSAENRRLEEIAEKVKQIAADAAALGNEIVAIDNDIAANSKTFNEGVARAKALIQQISERPTRSRLPGPKGPAYDQLIDIYQHGWDGKDPGGKPLPAPPKVVTDNARYKELDARQAEWDRKMQEQKEIISNHSSTQQQLQEAVKQYSEASANRVWEAYLMKNIRNQATPQPQSPGAAAQTNKVALP